MAAANSAEVLQKGEVVGLLQVGLWAVTLEHLEGLREGRGGGGGLGGQGDNDLLLEGEGSNSNWL